MYKLRNGFEALIAATLLCALAPAAQAAATYGNITAPGVVFGSGNPNGNFTIDTANGIELALRAKNYQGATIDGSSGVYHTTAGIVPGRPVNSPRAIWNYEFTINSGANALSNYLFRLGVDQDAGAGVNYVYVDPVTYFGDNATSGNFVTQNSENPIFGNTPGGALNVYSSGTYSFLLQAFARSTGDQLASVSTVVQVPEPESLALLGLGMIGLVAARRRKQ